MTASPKASRAKRTKPIMSVNDIEWEIIYAEESEAGTQALDEVNRIIYEFAVTNGYFKNTKREQVESKNTVVTSGMVIPLSFSPTLV